MGLSKKQIQTIAKKLPRGMDRRDWKQLYRAYQSKPRIRVVLTASKGMETKEGELEKQFHRSPRKHTAVKAYEMAKGWKVPPADWSCLELLGFWYSKYYEWSRSEYVIGRIRWHYNDIRFLVDRYGTEKTYQGIEVFFSEDMSWYNSKDLRGLTDIDKWARFIVPLLVSGGRKRGEQSEYTKDVSKDLVGKRRK